MEQLWTWSRVDGCYASGDLINIAYCCTYIDKELWFDLGKSMWSNHSYIFKYHVKYIHNDIVKPFKVGILQYSYRVC